MKNYTITVNGKAYDVTVEEKGGSVSAPAAAAAPVAATAAAPAPVAAPSGAGNKRIDAGAAGKVFKIPAKVGDSVKTGDPVVVLEIMKMETPVVAPCDGVIASIDVSEGQAVEAGALLATMNA